MASLPTRTIHFIYQKMLAPTRKPGARLWVIAILGAALAMGGGVAWWSSGSWLNKNKHNDKFVSAMMVRATDGAGEEDAPRAGAPNLDVNHVQLTEEQQRSIGLRTDRVVFGASPRVAVAPGRIAPNENQYAFITPRAAGVVRSVTAHVGQEVKAGDLLATVDSPEVGEARLDLYTKLQMFEIASSQATWESMIYANTLELLSLLKRGETPEQVHDSLEGRAVGTNRQRLMTAYTEYRLARTTLERNRDLYAQKLITPKDFEQVNARYESAQAVYQSLMDELGFEVKLENTRAQQALKQAETSLRAARERLRILGVKSDGTEPHVEGGKVVGVDRDGTLVVPRGGEHDGPDAVAGPEAILSAPPDSELVVVKPLGARPEDKTSPKDSPVSTFSIWAPFDGTILDREMIVPGVAVNPTHRIFTMANLATVWIEASVHEGDFDMLDRLRTRGGKIQFRSPAYPDHLFEGEVIYTGDLVEEQSRSVKLLARADNPDRRLRPGMFVEVEILSPRSDDIARVPASAILTDGDEHYVYVKNGPDSFTRREVDAEPPRGDYVAIRSGLSVGDEVVVKGGYKLKALAVQVASAAD